MEEALFPLALDSFETVGNLRRNQLTQAIPAGPDTNEASTPPVTQLGLTYIRDGYSFRSMAKKNMAQAPLTPAVLYILLALSTGERHGYGIMKQVQADSQGRAKMGPGTLYGSMGRMMEAGLIRESDKRVDPEMDDERRIYYELTGAGRAALEAELKRYRGVVAVAEGRLAHGN